MRSGLLPMATFGLALSMAMAAAAQQPKQPGTAAADLTTSQGTIALIDGGARRMTMNDGKTYELSGSVPLDAVTRRPGMDVMVAHHMKDGAAVATQVLPLSTAGAGTTGSSGPAGYADHNMSNTTPRR